MEFDKKKPKQSILNNKSQRNFLFWFTAVWLRKKLKSNLWPSLQTLKPFRVAPGRS